MSAEAICMLIAIVVYLLITIGIGIKFSKQNKDTDDFYLGGRKLGPFVTAMSAEASDMSSWLFTAILQEMPLQFRHFFQTGFEMISVFFL